MTSCCKDVVDVDIHGDVHAAVPSFFSIGWKVAQPVLGMQPPYCVPVLLRYHTLMGSRFRMGSVVHSVLYVPASPLPTIHQCAVAFCLLARASPHEARSPA